MAQSYPFLNALLCYLCHTNTCFGIWQTYQLSSDAAIRIDVSVITFTVMEIVYLIAGLILGGIIVYFIQKAKNAVVSDEQIQNHPVTAELRRINAATSQELSNERTENKQLTAELATAKREVLAHQEKLDNQMKELADMRAQFKHEFENLAQRIFEEKSNTFSKQNKEQLEVVLSPLRDKLKDFENKVEKVYGEESKERIALKVEIDKLLEMNSKLSANANNLASALKGSNKHQGNWGEMILEKILERSGLTQGQEFDKQVSEVNQDGQKIMPDIVVHLPENKHIIIDSKVSLVAYTNYVSTENDEERKQFLKAHTESIRGHIKLLSEKNYHSAKQLITPDFVLLFMPIEAAFSAAMQNDNELYNYAWDRKVVLVSPTTLLAMLRTIASIWKQEKRTRNAEAIAKEAGDLYDKFVGFTEDLIEVGKKLDDAKKVYSSSMNKLTEGKGNLVRRAENMRKLGANPTKSMNPKLIERAEDESPVELPDNNE